jgi:PAS domain S-box-containing protein
MDPPAPPNPGSTPASPVGGSAALLIAIIQSVPCRVYACDDEGRYILQNEASVRDFGSLIGRKVTDLSLPDAVVRRWTESVHRALAGEVVWIEQEVPLASTVRQYRSVLAPIREGGQVRGLVGIDIDVSELRRAEQELAESQRRIERALRESEAQYRLLAEHSSDLISRHSVTGQWVYVSPACLAVYGFEPEELIGTHPLDRVHPEDRQRVASAIQVALGTTQPQSLLFRSRHAEGRYIWLETRVRAVRDARTNEVAELVAISRDVTERMEAFHRQRRHDAQLAHADRLHTMGYMASEMAHELNQPLYAIANFADACLALMDRPAPAGSEMRRWLEQIAQQARRAGNVLRRISQFARKGEFNRRRIDLNRTIEDVVSMLEFDLRHHAIEVVLELAPTMPDIEGDQLLLEQVLVNLVRNAQEAMVQSAARTRRLTIRSFAPQGRRVGAAICDTGPGLQADQLERLFEPYFTTKPGGTGMGLAICRATIEAHDGEIWAFNNPHGGATFQFVIPVAALKEPAETTAAE